MIERTDNLALSPVEPVLIELDRRPVDPFRLRGYVVGDSGKLLMLHVVDGNTLALMGYKVVRWKDIRRWRPDESFVPRALELLGRTPVVPEGIDLRDWRSVLLSVNARCPLVAVEREKKRPGRMAIGRVVKVSERRLVIDEIDSDACWSGKATKKLKDITCVSFGDGYTEALAALDGAERQE